MSNTKSLVLFRKEDKPYVIMSKNLDADALLLLDKAIESADLDTTDLEIIETDVAWDLVKLIEDQRNCCQCIFSQISEVSNNLIDIYLEMAKLSNVYDINYIKFKELTKAYVNSIEVIKRKLEGSDDNDMYERLRKLLRDEL